MLHVDESGNAARPLGLGDDVLADGGLAGALGAIDLGDAPAGDATDAQGNVEGEGAGGDRLHMEVAGLSQLHNGALTVALVDILQGGFQGSRFSVVAHSAFPSYPDAGSFF